ncbi:hypothetical protein GMMP1_990024 [Candidatus Magnetomoraceae bacterium gMMP-1]
MNLSIISSILGFLLFIAFTGPIGKALQHFLDTEIEYSASYAQNSLYVIIATILFVIILSTSLAVWNIIRNKPAMLLKE